MPNYLRNTQTGEFKDVEPESQEFRDLTAQRGPDNKPVWEQTGDHQVAAIQTRAADDALRESDLGKQDQAALQDPANEVQAWGADPYAGTYLTPGEIAQGITRQGRDASLANSRVGDIDANNSAVKSAAAETIQSSDTQRVGGVGSSEAGTTPPSETPPSGDLTPLESTSGAAPTDTHGQAV